MFFQYVKQFKTFWEHIKVFVLELAIRLLKQIEKNYYISIYSQLNRMKKLLLLIFVCHFFYGNIKAQNITKDYFDYIRYHGISPIEYLTDKLHSYSVVALGEDHWIKDHPNFLCNFLSTTSKDSLTDVDILALEFGNNCDQKLVDEFLKADTYREDLVFKILEHAPDTYGNPYLEYAKIFQTVWETNRLKSPKRKIRIILLDPEYVQANMDGEKFVYTGSRDDNMFSIIRNYIMNKQHVLFYGGAAHTQAQIRGVKYNGSYYNFPSAGYLLKKCYPKDVFIINLWGAYMGNYGYEADSQKKWLQIDNGTIDKAFYLNGNKPTAFDMGGPFNNLTAKQYYANPKSPNNWGNDTQSDSPYNTNILMKDWIDGIIFIGPICKFTGQTLIDIYDNEFLKNIERRSKGQFHTSKDVLEYLRKIHPILQ